MWEVADPRVGIAVLGNLLVPNSDTVESCPSDRTFLRL